MTVDTARSIDATELADVRAVHPNMGNGHFGERVVRETDHLQDAQRFVVECNRARAIKMPGALSSTDVRQTSATTRLR